MKMLLQRLGVGVMVDVMDPQHSDSPHNASFTGTIINVEEEYVTVEDMEGDCWDIAYDEISEFSHPEAQR